MKYGDTITLLATVTNNEESTFDDEETSQEITITITIVQEAEDEESEDESDNLNQLDDNEETDTKLTENNTDNQTQVSMDSLSMGNESQLSTNTTSSETTLSTTAKSSNDTQTVTYNGSSNNYLSEISIEGYEFTNSFSKENTTYFVKVDSEVESLTVNYTKDDDDSTVCIYGNDDLDNNSNKILIFVTAENGDVRTYRIIVIEED